MKALEPSSASIPATRSLTFKRRIMGRLRSLWRRIGLAPISTESGQCVQFVLQIELDGNDRYKRVVEVFEVDVVIDAVTRCMERIDELARLQPGWLDGDGAALSDLAIKTSKYLLLLAKSTRLGYRSSPCQKAASPLNLSTMGGITPLSSRWTVALKCSVSAPNRGIVRPFTALTPDPVPTGRPAHNKWAANFSLPGRQGVRQPFDPPEGTHQRV